MADVFGDASWLGSAEREDFSGKILQHCPGIRGSLGRCSDFEPEGVSQLHLRTLPTIRYARKRLSAERRLQRMVVRMNSDSIMILE